MEVWSGARGSDIKCKQNENTWEKGGSGSMDEGKEGENTSDTRNND